MSLQLSHRHGRWYLSGELNSAPPAQSWWSERLSAVDGGQLELDLFDLELEGGAALIGLVTLFRQLAQQGYSLSLHHVPQLLAHTLYRVADLENGAIAVISMCEEEPYG